nr:hypothetical protein [Tanacetum cinerariifolium]
MGDEGVQFGVVSVNTVGSLNSIITGALQLKLTLGVKVKEGLGLDGIGLLKTIILASSLKELHDIETIYHATCTPTSPISAYANFSDDNSLSKDLQRPLLGGDPRTKLRRERIGDAEIAPALCQAARLRGRLSLVNPGLTPWLFTACFSSLERPSKLFDFVSEKDQTVDIITLPKFDMPSHESNMSAKDVKSLALHHGVPLDLHLVALTKGWTTDKLPDDMIGLYEHIAIPDVMAWRHHNSHINDHVSEDGFSAQDMETLAERVIDIRPIPSGLLFQGRLATT